jgi:hypothetical protein
VGAMRCRLVVVGTGRGAGEYPKTESLLCDGVLLFLACF